MASLSTTAGGMLLTLSTMACSMQLIFFTISSFHIFTSIPPLPVANFLSYQQQDPQQWHQGQDLQHDASNVRKLGLQLLGPHWYCISQGIGAEADLAFYSLLHSSPPLCPSQVMCEGHHPRVNVFWPLIVVKKVQETPSRGLNLVNRGELGKDGRDNDPEEYVSAVIFLLFLKLV